MKYLSLVLAILFFSNVQSSDTLYVENSRDPRLLLYQDSIKAYEIGFSVAKNIADSVRSLSGNNSLDHFFLSRYIEMPDASSAGYFYEFHENVKVEIGHVNDSFHGMKSDTKFPWRFLELQDKRLDAIKIQPAGIMQGGELPNVYIYAKPSTTVIYRKVKRFTVIDPSIKFFMKDNGKTRVSYIVKYHYSQIGNEHQQTDSVEKLDPIKQQHLFY